MSYRRITHWLLKILLPIFCFKMDNMLSLSASPKIEEKRLTQRLAVSDAPLIRIIQ